MCNRNGIVRIIDLNGDTARISIWAMSNNEPQLVYGEFIIGEQLLINVNDVKMIIGNKLTTQHGTYDMYAAHGSYVCKAMKQHGNSEFQKLKRENELLRSDIKVLKDKLQEQFDLEPDSHSAQLQAARDRFIASSSINDSQ